MPLKMHIIVHHYRDYFEQSGETLLKYTDEFTESMHSQLRQFEESHHYKKLKFECESHAEAQNKSIVHINSLKLIRINKFLNFIKKSCTPYALDCFHLSVGIFYGGNKLDNGIAASPGNP